MAEEDEKWDRAAWGSVVLEESRRWQTNAMGILLKK